MNCRHYDLFMKNFIFLLLVITFFISLPSYSNQAQEEPNFSKMRKRFEKIDKNGDGLISKSEMIEAHRDRIDKLFLKFDKNSDGKLSRKELSAVKKEIKKRIFKLRKDGE